MNKSKRVLKNIAFIVAIVLLTVAGYFLFTVISGKENIFIKMINEVNDKKVDKDNYNGVYVYSEKIGYSVVAFAGCTVDSFDQYIAIIDSDYYIYDYTCMGTYLKSSGKTAELNFNLNKETNLYSINYDDKVFTKNNSVRSVVEGNIVKDKLSNISLSSYQFIMKYSQFKGNEYSISSRISGVSNYWLSINPTGNGTFDLALTGKNPETKVEKKFNYAVSDLDSFPDIKYSFSKMMIILKNKNENGLYNYDMKTFDYNNGTQYSLKDKFPIEVSDVRLDYDNNSVYVKFDSLNRYYNVLVGYNNDFCEEASDSNEVAFYLFKVGYDSKSYSLGKPEYVNTYYKKDGCSVVKSIMEG